MENGEPAEEGGPEAVFYRLVWLNLYDTCSSMLAGKRSWGGKNLRDWFAECRTAKQSEGSKKKN